MRLIDADKLENHFEKVIEYYEKKQKTSVFSDKCKLLEGAFRDALARIKSQPTLEERPKGKWILDNSKNYSWGWDDYKCSNCGEAIGVKCIDNGFSLESHCKDKFCRHCGAEMEVE